MNKIFVGLLVVLAVTTANGAEIVRYVNTASSGGNGTTNETSGATAAYVSLNAGLAAEATDLVTAGNYIIFKCSGTAADTTIAVVGTGWTTGADNYIEIMANTGQEAGTSWDTSKYRLEITASGNFQACIRVREDFVIIEGIQAKMTQGAWTDCGAIQSMGGDLSVTNLCVVRKCHAQGGQYAIRFADSDSRLNISNSIFYGATINQVSNYDDNSNIENCTLYGTGTSTGITNGKAINVVSYNNVKDFNSMHASSNYNFSKDDSAIGANSIHGDTASKTPDFTSVTDFSLQSTSDLIDVGTSGVTLGHTDDILGTARGAVWDIGAYEYVAAEPPPSSSGNWIPKAMWWE